MTRTAKIKAGKIWQVHRDMEDEVLFEGSRTACMKFIKDKFGLRQYRNGTIRVGQLLYESMEQLEEIAKLKGWGT